jgi:hypothetical protein
MMSQVVIPRLIVRRTRTAAVARALQKVATVAPDRARARAASTTAPQVTVAVLAK